MYVFLDKLSLIDQSWASLVWLLGECLSTDLREFAEFASLSAVDVAFPNGGCW